MQCLLSPGPKNTSRVLSVLRTLGVPGVVSHELSEGFTLFVLNDGAIPADDSELLDHYCWTTNLPAGAIEQYLIKVERGSPPLLLFQGLV